MTNPRDLIQNMARELDLYRQIARDNCTSTHPLADQARAALAQPEPEVPTDEELLAIAAASIDPYQDSGIAIGEYEPETEHAIEVYGSELIAFARAVLARWGRPSIEPVPVSERPWEREGWCDGDGWCWWFDADDPGWVFDQPKLVIWTHCLPAHALPRPVPTQHGCTQLR